MRIGAFSIPLLVFALLLPAESLAQGGKALPGKIVTAIDARVAGDDKRTRFVIDLNGKAEMSAFTLADPYRVVLDFPDVVFKLPASAGKSGRGLVSAFRYGVFAPGKARVVIDTKEPVAIDRSFTVDAYEAQPARLVLDLVPTSRDNFIKSAATKQKQAPPVHTASLPPADASAKSGPPIIVIDAGHGGIDSGAVAPSGVEEKAVVLAVAKKLAEKLERTRQFRVILTRYDDTFLPLQERVQMARMNAAALFISIHADSISRKDGDARGASIYTVSDRASDADAARLADKENRADAIAGVDLSGKSDDVAGILVDLAHRETKNFSGLFARTLAGRMQSATPMHPSPLRSAGFTVLRAPDVPSVLVELGFLSNSLDVRLLTSDVWRERVTDAMTEAVHTFFQGRLTAAR
ncbi:MAG TPA: N-acetylmuramoyl-L-alanine amidase [Xanthobacteraceae bacterium]|nr:N-acetylmuramoyl-L-alanine amidase [Xanthobacteraceae bacterium]